MKYGDILTRAWRIIWDNKFLILLGVIVALGSSSGGGGSPGGAGSGRGSAESAFRGWDMPNGGLQLGLPEVAVVVIALGVIGLAVLVAIALWVVSTIARGGLIAGASAIDEGGTSTFSEALGAGWERGWRLLGIGVLPAIPGFVLMITGLVAGGAFAALYGLLGEEASIPSGAGLGAIFVTMACVLLPISLILGLLRTFANRACMLEDLGVIASYRRGLKVLVDNIEQAIVLFLLQVVISVALFIGLALPRLVICLCCILWPLLLLIRGAITSYFSTLWTLAWREWTALAGPDEMIPETAFPGEAS